MTKTQIKSSLFIVAPADGGLMLSSGKVGFRTPNGPALRERWTPAQWKAFYKVRDAYHPFDRFASMVRLTAREIENLKAISPSEQLTREIEAKRAARKKRSLAAKRAWKNRR
jgi:hypothetical protein